MHPETLYAFLETIGVRWSISRKDWYRRGGIADPVRSRRGTDQPNIDSRNAVSVRITADVDIIDKVVDEFFELADALDWEAKVGEKKYMNSDGRTCRRYITITKRR